MERKHYRVNEIFYSLQGEGRNTGRAALFLRMSGCNLRCPFCDTDFTQFRHMTVDEIVDAFRALTEECRLVVITGGEPSLQVDDELVEGLHTAGYHLAIETNGTLPIHPGIDFVTISPKCSFVEGAELAPNRCDELKLVYDGKHEVSGYGLSPTFRYLQPCDTGNASRNKEIMQDCIEYIKSHPQWQLSLQTHKMVGIQ